MIYHEGIKIYDENTMYCFKDGTDYSIDGCEYSCVEDDGKNKDDTREENNLPEKYIYITIHSPL
jgi:hypothetical protein